MARQTDNTEDLLIRLYGRLLLFLAPGFCALTLAAGFSISELFLRALDSDSTGGWAFARLCLVVLAAVSLILGAIAINRLWVGRRPSALLADEFLWKEILLLPRGFPASQLAMMAFGGLAVLALPYWASGAFWIVFMILVLLVPMYGSHSLNPAGMVLVILSIATAVFGLIGGPRLVAVVLGVLLLALCGIAALHYFNRAREDRRDIVLGATPAAALIPPLALLPGFGAMGAFFIAFLLTGVVAGAVILRWMSAKSDLENRLQASDALVDGPSVSQFNVRETDGFGRLCVPAWRPWSKTEPTESGYVYNLGGDRDPCFAGLQSECIVIRQASTTNFGLEEVRDQKAQRWAEYFSDLLPLKEFARNRWLSGLTEAFEDASPLLVFDPSNESRLVAKFPWDSPYVHIVPLKVPNIVFQYPAFAGLVDRAGRPAGVHNVEVTIALQDEVVEAARRIEKASFDRATPEDVDLALCRELLWHSRSVVSSVYAAIFRVLAEKLPTLDLTRMEQRDGDPRALREDVSAALADGLPRELSRGLERLITVSVGSASPELYLSAHINEATSGLRAAERTASARLAGRLGELISRFDFADVQNWRPANNEESPDSVFLNSAPLNEMLVFYQNDLNGTTQDAKGIIRDALTKVVRGADVQVEATAAIGLAEEAHRRYVEELEETLGEAKELLNPGSSAASG